MANIIRSSTYVSPKARIGIGVAILPYVSVGTNVTVSDGIMINMNAS